VDEFHRLYLSDTHLLMAKLLYGSGLRLIECLRLRVKDIDFAQRQIRAEPVEASLCATARGEKTGCGLQKAVRAAARAAKIPKKVSCHPPPGSPL